MEEFAEKLLFAAIEKAIEMLLESARDAEEQILELGRQLHVVELKIDAIIIGTLETACARLREAHGLAGHYRTRSFEGALDSFEQFSGQAKVLLDNGRKALRLSHAVDYVNRSGCLPLEMDFTFRLEAYEMLERHLALERLRATGLLGALRAAHEIGDPLLKQAKMRSLNAAIKEGREFLVQKKSEIRGYHLNPDIPAPAGPGSLFGMLGEIFSGGSRYGKLETRAAQAEATLDGHLAQWREIDD